MKLSKIYEPKQYEPTTYALWESSGAFSPSTDTSKDPYCIVMPPPNANGLLHTGTAITVLLEDLLIRYHRMRGERTEYIPGADHAGFETWVVYERLLEKEGKSRFDFSRDELYKQTWDFVAQQRSNMEVGLRALGVSCDWDSLTFTLDENVIERAYQTFKKLWDDGLVYRGERLVNYCTKHRTGFSDIEVEHIDRKTPLYYMRYGPFVVATTRPETKFGDTAVAVHPDDERYKKYVGKEITVEGLNGPFKLKVVADKYVDPKFGTGVVKITPAHDFNDWEVAQRHKLPAVRVIEFDGRLNKNAGRFAGLTVPEAREQVVKALEEKGLLVKVDKSYKNRVGVCYKCKTVIEPMLMDQWFVKMEPLAKPAIKAVVSNKIKFFPESKKRVLLNYLENIKDWNISRQIPWGIPIPAFQNEKDPDDWVFDTSVDKETIKKGGKTYRRDPDTFDTWFSSGQWPYIVTQNQKGRDLSSFYPTSVMETGHDLIDRWVSRMIMLGLYASNKIPFKDVYLHGMVLDPHGQKMSKSKGNVLNPQDAIDEYGSDALRMGLIANRSAGSNQAYSPASTIAGRNFCNKLWNIARYIEDKIGDKYKNRTPAPVSLVDHWFLGRLKTRANKVTKLLDSYRFAEAFEIVYHLVWDDFADWYVEASKLEPNDTVLAYSLETILKLVHPFAPFVTETIWQTLKWEDNLLISSDWPTFDTLNYDSRKAAQFPPLQTLITEVRYLQQGLGTRNLELQFADNPLLNEQKRLIDKLAHVSLSETSSPRGMHVAHPTIATWLVVDEKTLKTHKERLASRLEDVEARITNLELRLKNDRYINQAPKEIVAQTRSQLREEQELHDRLTVEIKAFTA